MTTVDSSKIHITSEVFDFMFIRIENPVLEKSSLQYSILTNDGALIRKGVFRGTVIQLRLSHLSDGAYNIHLQCQPGAAPIVHSFKKYTPARGEQTMFSF